MDWYGAAEEKAGGAVRNSNKRVGEGAGRKLATEYNVNREMCERGIKGKR